MKHPTRWLWLVFSIFWLAACGSQPETTTLNVEEQPPAEEQNPDTGETNETGETSEISSSFSPAANLVEASLERDQDFAKGGEDPLLTIIEYGDFQ